MSGTDVPIVTCACASKRAEPLRGFSGGNQPRATGTGEDARRMGFSERTRRTRSPPRGTAPRAARSPRTAPPRPSRTRARRAPRRARRRRRPHPRLGARGLSARRPGGRRTASRRTRPGTRRARRRTPRASRASPRGGRDPRRGVSGRQAATARACLRLSRTTRETAPRRPSERRFPSGATIAHAVVFHTSGQSLTYFVNSDSVSHMEQLPVDLPPEMMVALRRDRRNLYAPMV